MAFSQHHCSDRSGFCDLTRSTKRPATARLPLTSLINRWRVDRGTPDGPVGNDGTPKRIGNRYPVNQQKTATTSTAANMTEKDMIDFPVSYPQTDDFSYKQ